MNARESAREKEIEAERQKLFSLFEADAHEVAIVLHSGSFYVVHQCDYEEVFNNLKSEVIAVHRVA